jgi:hypothetical protein
MQNSNIKRFFRKLRTDAARRPQRVVVTAMGSQKVFHAYDLGADTIVFEKDVWAVMDEHASVLVAEKNDLAPGSFGHLLTVTSGNHSVAALPLLSGKLWDLCDLPAEKRSDAMMHAILVANVVGGKLEISQRDVPCAKLVVLDDWLIRELGFSLDGVVMAERNDETLQHFRELGQEWRVKPLAWSEAGIRAAVAQSRKRIASPLNYYHSVKGVHFLSWPEFHRFASLARSDFPAFRAGLAELVGVYEGNETSFMRMPKFGGHHEIEFFGLLRGSAVEKIVPRLEELLGDIETEPDRAPGRIAEIDTQFRALLTRPEYADDTCAVFAETLYMHLTGEVYAVSGEGSSIAFDARRTALPGATFVNGAPQYHPGTDARTEVLLSNVRQVLSKDEFLEYANVYELRTEETDRDQGVAPGEGRTREIVFKTNCRPLPSSFVEKRLSSSDDGYGAYVLARIESFKAIGICLPDYRLLRHRSFGKRRLIYDYYIRTRCEGEPLAGIPANLLTDPAAQDQIAFLMGDAAAQNLAMKKYDAAKKSALFGIGKEIYRFAWDAERERLLPASVSICSVRGSCGWPDLACTERNFRTAARFYMRAYAQTFLEFVRGRDVSAVRRTVLCERFLAGFERRTRAIAFRIARYREDFIRFAPPIPARYRFSEKGVFAIRSLVWQASHLDVCRDLFLRFVNSRKPC